MDHKHLVETWLYFGIIDLFYSFHWNVGLFDHYRAFFAIMAVEKHFKALILFHRRAEFKSLTEAEGNRKVEQIARKYNHDFRRMAKEIHLQNPDSQFCHLIKKDFSGYKGYKLLRIFPHAYQETRYPTLSEKKVFRRFPTGKKYSVGKQKKDIYFDPLSSPGLLDFANGLCEFVICQFTESTEVSIIDKILYNVTAQYKHLESFERFKNTFLRKQWP